MPPPKYEPLQVVKVQAYACARAGGRTFSPRTFEVLVLENHGHADLTTCWDELYSSEFTRLGFLLEVENVITQGL